MRNLSAKFFGIMPLPSPLKTAIPEFYLTKKYVEFRYKNQKT